MQSENKKEKNSEYWKRLRMSIDNESKKIQIKQKRHTCRLKEIEIDVAFGFNILWSVWWGLYAANLWCLCGILMMDY